MKKTNNIWGNASKFLTIMITSLIFVSCSTVEGEGKGKTVIANTTLATAFDGTATDLSTAIVAVKGTAGIVAGEISLTAPNGIFADDSVAITLEATDTTAVLQVPAMENSIKTAIDTILTLNDNVVAGLLKVTTIKVEIVDAFVSTATVTFTVEEGFEFEDKTTSKTLTLNLTGNFDGTKTVIANTTDIVGTTITAVSTKAGITAFTITGFVDPTVALTFDGADNTKILQAIAVKNSIVESLTTDAELKNMLPLTANDIVYALVSGSSATATVTFTAKAGYEFEGASATKIVTLNLTGTFTPEEPPTVGNTYEISKSEHLMWLSGKDITQNIKFMNDIDMSGVAFTGIKTFAGTIIDGNGKKIQNLKINNTGDAGLILSVDSGTTVTIKNLTIESGSITSERNAAAFIGYSVGTVTLTGLVNKAAVTTGNGKAAGMIANNRGTAIIKNSVNTGVIKITGLGIVGGLVGYNDVSASTIEESHSYQALALVGGDDGPTTITASYYLGGISSGNILTATDFKNQANFVGWDFGTTWTMGALYPELK